MNGLSLYIIEGFGFEVSLRTFQGPDAAIRRAMFALMADGRLDPKGTPEETMEGFRVVSRIACG